MDTSIYNSNENQVFSIYMTGGKIQDKIVEVKDDPLLNAGDKVLVFCKKNSDGTYHILGGPQGRLVYENGKFNSLNVVNTRVKQSNTSSNIVIENEDAATLINEIKGYIKEKQQ